MLTRLSLLTFLATAATPVWAADTVEMQLNEFLKLYDASKVEPKVVTEAAPLPYALTSAKYQGEVVLDGDGEPSGAVFKAAVRLDVLKDTGWVRVPLLHNAAALSRATIDGRDASVVNERGHYVLITDRTGPFTVNLEFAVSVTQNQGQAMLNFPLMPSAATEVELTVPGEDNLDFTVANARLQRDTSTRGGRKVTAVLPSDRGFNVSWAKKVEVAPTKEDAVEARRYAETHTLVTIGEGVLTARSVLSETILFAGVDQITAQIPDGMTVLDVSGQAGLRDWSVSEDGVLTALLNFEAEGAYALTVQMERVIEADEASVEMPVLQPLGVERSKGFVGVTVDGAMELGEGDVQRAAAVDVRTLPNEILGRTQSPVLLGYKYVGDEPEIPVIVEDHDDVEVLVTLVDQANATTMFTQDGRRLTAVSYQVRNNRRQFLRVAMPEGAELWSAGVAGRAVQPATDGETLLLPLVRSNADGGSLAAFDVQIVYVENGTGPDGSGRGVFEGELPTVDAPSTYVAWSVYAPEQAKVEKLKSMDGSLRAVDLLSRPIPATRALQVQRDNAGMRRSANRQAASGTMGSGAAPVQVTLPLDGEPYFFEKLLALDERLWVEFDYKGLK